MTSKLPPLVPLLATTLADSLPNLCFTTLKVLREITQACDTLGLPYEDQSTRIRPLIDFYVDILDQDPFSESAIETSIIINELSSYVAKK